MLLGIDDTKNICDKVNPSQYLALRPSIELEHTPYSQCPTHRVYVYISVG